MSFLTTRIQEGLNGKYQGLSNGFDTLNKYVFGIQRSTYYLIGGSSGTYKTTLLDYMVRNAIRDANENQIKCNVFYYSFEIDKITKMCNWTSSLIYQMYHLQSLYSFKSSIISVISLQKVPLKISGPILLVLLLPNI
jgi:replicative DNA helicase